MTRRYKWHFTKNIRLATPVMLGQLGQVMVGVADNIMVGHVGKIPLAAASLANSLFIIIMVFGIGASFAISPITAQAQGEDDFKKISNILKHSILISLVMGVILAVLVFVIGFTVPFLNQPEAVADMAIPYLNVIGISIFPLLVFQTYRQFSEGLSITVPPMMIIIGSNIINIILNYIFIYGKLGFPAMGLLGAGYATLISRVIMALVIIYYIHRNRRFSLYLKYLPEITFSFAFVKRILSLGLPMGLQFTFEVTAFAFAAIMIGWLGATELAAHQIAINLAAVAFMAATGIGSAASIRVGNQMGKKDIKTMREAAFTCYFMVIAIMSFSAIMFVSFNYFLPSLYIDNQDVIEMAAILLVIAAIFQLSDGLQVIGLGCLRGISDVKVPTIITFIAYWGLALPSGYLLGFHFDMGAQGVWYGLLIGLSVAAILLFIRFNRVTLKMLNNQAVKP